MKGADRMPVRSTTDVFVLLLLLFTGADIDVCLSVCDLRLATGDLRLARARGLGARGLGARGLGARRGGALWTRRMVLPRVGYFLPWHDNGNGLCVSDRSIPLPLRAPRARLRVSVAGSPARRRVLLRAVTPLTL